MRFIGREDQLAWLEARLADVRDGGTGQILSVDGGLLAHHPAYSEFIKAAGY